MPVPETAKPETVDQQIYLELKNIGQALEKISTTLEKLLRAYLKKRLS